MYLIDEQNVKRLQIGENGRQVTRLLQHRAGGLPQLHTQFIGDDMGQGGLTQARWAEQQDMVQCFAPATRGADKDLKLFPQLGLADELGQFRRPQTAIEGLLILIAARY